MPSDNKTLRASASISLTLVFTVLAVLAQAQNPRGALRGVVQDAKGGRVAAASVSVLAHEAAAERNVTSDSRGEFRVDDLLPGSYHLLVRAQGFTPAASDVRVLVSSVRDVTVTLKPAPVSQTLTVQGDSSSVTTQAIDKATAVHQAVVTVQDLQNIPMASRSFANIAYLAPGTEPVEPSDPTKARITAVAFGGSSGLPLDFDEAAARQEFVLAGDRRQVSRCVGNVGEYWCGRRFTNPAGDLPADGEADGDHDRRGQQVRGPTADAPRLSSRRHPKRCDDELENTPLSTGVDCPSPARLLSSIHGAPA